MFLNILFILFIFVSQLDRKIQAIHFERQNAYNHRRKNVLYNKYIEKPHVNTLCSSSLTPREYNISKDKQVFFVPYCSDISTPYKLGVHKLRIDILENKFSNNNIDNNQKKFLFLFHISNSNKSENFLNYRKKVPKITSYTNTATGMKLMCPEILPNFTSFKRKDNIFLDKKLSPEFIRKLQSTNMKKYIDFTTNPCKDFYQFACGNWLKYNPISKDNSGYDTFEMLREHIDKLIRGILSNDDKLKHNNFCYKKNFKNQLQKIAPYQYKKNTNHTCKVFLNNISLKTHIVSNRIFQQLKNFKYKIKRRFKSKKNKKSKSISAELKAKLLFQSCMNVKILKEKGISPLLELLKHLGGWPVLDDKWTEKNFNWVNLTALLRLYNNDVFILEWVGPDLKNSDVNIIQLDQANLGLPSRDFFLNQSNSLYVNAYKRFMIEIMNILGSNNENSEKTAEELIIFETELGNITTSTDDRINFSIMYNQMSIISLCKEIPDIDWNNFLSIIHGRIVDNHETVVVYAVDYFKRLSKLIRKTKTKIIANYMLWRFVRHRINNLDDRFNDIKQRFFHTLFGREQNPPRWKNCVAQVNSNMGMAVGAMFVRKHFDENSKSDTLKMTLNLQQAFLDILNGTTWLDEKTKILAEHKVKLMSWKIGYPDFILSQTILDEKYASLDIKVNQYFQNTLNILKYITKMENLKLKMSVDKTLWEIAPAVVNAYYSRNKNQIIFPAGILQPPFYHRYFPRSLNYGGIGVVIGHELTHGFDDKGRLFDSSGNVHKWWSDSAINEFHKRAKCLISQYGNYTVTEDGISIDGEKTQGENIADNGGIKQAFHAYKTWLEKNINSNRENEIFENLNFTSKQLFFLNFAQIWCGTIRSEALRSKIKTGVHSPGKFRVIGSLSNLKEFSQEFHCPVGSPMNPNVKCSIW